MFKRANKITALLVAAATVMSVVPAMAATKLGTKDGTIDNGVAFKDGKYLYEGYRTSDDDKGIYYNAGDKDKKLDDATEIDNIFGKYGDKQVAVQDGNDKYMVDLSTGKITDDDTAEDLTTTAQAKLDTKLAKTERYGNIAPNANIQPIDSEDADNDGRYDQKDRFGDIWYAYSANSAGTATALTNVTTTAAGATYTGYTSQSGAYIDASKNANIYVFNGYKMVKVENLGDTEKKGTESLANDVTLDSIQYVKTLGQDKDNIYRLVKVHVTGAKSVVSPLTADETLYYVQKISKAQGDKEKGAYLPKTTESYLLEAKNTGLGNAGIGNGDVGDAYDAIVNNLGRVTYIVDGTVYTTFQDDEKVKTIKISLKTSTKLDRYDRAGNKITDNSASKIDSHVAAKDTDKDTKANDWSIDVNGNVWAIYDGEIKESIKAGDFKTVYTCDRSLNALDAYDEKNILAWDTSGDVYTNVTEGTAQAEADAGTIVNPTPAKIGWDKLADGSWNFYDGTGAKIVNNWANAGGVWYFLKADGVMATGWENVGGTWYYLASSGAMKTGWVSDNGTWYFLQSSGAMKTGWVNDNGTWYYLNANGSMAANTTVQGYVLNASGAWVK